MDNVGRRGLLRYLAGMAFSNTSINLTTAERDELLDMAEELRAEVLEMPEGMAQDMLIKKETMMDNFERANTLNYIALMSEKKGYCNLTDEEIRELRGKDSRRLL